MPLSHSMLLACLHFFQVGLFPVLILGGVNKKIMVLHEKWAAAATAKTAVSRPADFAKHSVRELARLKDIHMVVKLA